jgi:3-oxoacyl-[acyl-carrier protein] reductase
MNQDENIRALLRPMLPLGRLGKDSEIASLIAYLASPEASFITGAALTIDGGYLS